MDRERAAELKKRLRNVGRALDRAVIATKGIDKVECDALLEHLTKACAIVYGKLFDIYDQHPELKPRPKPPRISSTLTWDEVSLSRSVSVTELDRIIFSVMERQWRKMMMIVGQAFVECTDIGLAINSETIAARIQALASAGHFESQGDLRYWGNSMIRLKD
ncbi:DUF3658 domain-containing protein [Bradyrhizobium septentrionale]|uniref:DUF3658 domain-containing protein n=1 Tax=Bradyrhizobium septentrionale TaxID=1404411 RepID=A0A973WA15_9BRAD|nr:DUF3658 domain-containing protein [Bradyrhizobium septentrionale]UGY18544.1 DUF3658 domain-containing protein [Bradyrhizobium septentrionale]UGY27074.1 DUF3658 domain-containing protein [Bradyrhizobium septentrionale]